MRAWVGAAAMALAVMAGPANAAGCGKADVACLTAAVATADATLATNEAAAAAAIDAWEGNLTDDDRPAWKTRLADESAAWRRYVDRRCASARPAADLACRLALTTVRSGDLAARYDLADGARYRADLENAAPEPVAAIGEPEQAGSEYGPCQGAPTDECDLCGVAACFEGLIAKAEKRHAKALAKAAVKARRAGVLAEEEAWSAFVDLACENQAWETPNRWAHSVGVQIIEPCRLAEIDARTLRLKAIAGATR